MNVMQRALTAGLGTTLVAGMVLSASPAGRQRDPEQPRTHAGVPLHQLRRGGRHRLRCRRQQDSCASQARSSSSTPPSPGTGCTSTNTLEPPSRRTADTWSPRPAAATSAGSTVAGPKLVPLPRTRTTVMPLARSTRPAGRSVGPEGVRHRRARLGHQDRLAAEDRPRLAVVGVPDKAERCGEHRERRGETSGQRDLPGALALTATGLAAGGLGTANADPTSPRRTAPPPMRAG